jgi:hypothetical protein
MVIFHSYVSLAEGISDYGISSLKNWDKMVISYLRMALVSGNIPRKYEARNMVRLRSSISDWWLSPSPLKNDGFSQLG